MIEIAASITSAVVGIWLAYVGHGVWSLVWAALVLAATQSVTPPNMRALSQAVLLLTFNLFGLGLGPLFTGVVSDALARAYGDDSLRYALVAALIPSALSAVVFVYAGRFHAGDRRSGSGGVDAGVRG